MRINDVNPVRVLSMSAAPVVRAHEGTRVFTPVSGVEAVLAAPSVVTVDQAACLHVAKAEAALWLKSVAGGYGQQMQVRTTGGLTGSQGTSGFVGGVRVTGTDGQTSFAGVTSSTSTSTNDENPIDPRDFRTSSPPG